MAVPFLNLQVQYQAHKQEFDKAILDILSAAQFVGGPAIAAFEKEFAAYCESGGCAALNSGTDALAFSLMAMGIGPGDEVITVPNTFIATTEAITQAGASIRFVDVLPDTMLMDPRALERAMNPRVKCIIPVHLTGLVCDMDAIGKIAREHGAVVLEDACQAHGSRYKGRRAGSMGKAGCFSFYPGKNLGAFGEGGAVVSDAGDDTRVCAWEACRKRRGRRHPSPPCRVLRQSRRGGRHPRGTQGCGLSGSSGRSRALRH